jgi:cell division protein FtsW
MKKRVYAGGVETRYLLMAAAFLLSAFGLVMVYSASSITASAKEGVHWYYLLRQSIFLFGGWIGALALGRFDYRKLKEIGWMLWFTCLALLFVVLVMGFASHGAQRWIPLGFMNLQPSELAKIACIILVAALAAEWDRGRLSTRMFANRVALVALVPAVFIMLQPDMGTTVTLFVAVGIVLLLAGMKVRWVIAIAAVVVPAGAAFIAVSEYRTNRVLGFLDPFADPLGKGFQSIQALLAFGTGGIDGVGLGLSRQKFFYLPEAYTDFILAIIGEEFGLIGTIGVVAAFGVITWTGFKIATGARDPYGRLIAGGVTGMMAFQAIMNMSAVVGLMPVTGKPLPFLSYGGSSMLVTMISFGLLLSVSEFGMLAPRAVRPRSGSKETSREAGHERRRDGRPRLSRIDGGRAARRRA